MGKNAIVGQSGGPTSVINASLAGVFESCKNRGAQVVYGMCNGVAGLLEENVVDLSKYLTDDLDIELLKRTPSSFLGSCRYKLPDWHDDEAVYKKLFAILEKLNVGYFFYIGGNDSMDTIGKLADYGNCIQSDIRFMGVPKTIDNDLMVTDHTPGYGSAAKYIGVVMKEIIRDATVYRSALQRGSLRREGPCDAGEEAQHRHRRFRRRQAGGWPLRLRAGRRCARSGRLRPQGPDRHRPVSG